MIDSPILMLSKFSYFFSVGSVSGAHPRTVYNKPAISFIVEKLNVKLLR